VLRIQASDHEEICEPASTEESSGGVHVIRPIAIVITPLIMATLGVASLHAANTTTTGQASASKARTDSILKGLGMTNTEQRDAAASIVELLAAQEVNAKMEEKEIDDATNAFKGFGPGVGISVTWYSSDNRPIHDAEVVNGIVRVTDESAIAASIMFETHYFFTAGRDSTWGYGPYAGVLSSTENVIDAFGLGCMLGKRRDPKGTGSFNIGAGVVINPKVQVLGDGITADKPLPSGETEIRFKTKSAWGVQLMAAFHF
jgi:hypothetical protein